MSEKLVHSKEEALEENLWFLFKGQTETLRMWRQTTCHLNYEHYSGPDKGKSYISVQDLGWMSYSLSPLKGCPAVLVSHNSWLNEDKRKFGLGDYFHKERLDLARQADRSCMLCTVDASNYVEKHILEKNGWKRVHEFHNKDTGNDVEIWVNNL